MPAIEVEGLQKRYRERVAVDGLTFSVEPGEVFGLLGPNGAGKTTTVEILEGYREADGGHARVLGLDPRADNAALRRRIGVMLQSGGLYPGLRPLEVLELFAAYYEDAESPAALLETVGLADRVRTPVRRLSGGEAQRLSLACALIGRPDVLFLDEPTAGMDPHARATTWELVRTLSQRGVTILLTTHAMDEAERMCSRVAIISGGRMVAQGSPIDLVRARAADEVWFTTDAAIEVAMLAKVLGVAADAVREERPGEYSVNAPATPERLADLACYLRDHGITLRELRAGQASLEAVFLTLTQEHDA
jgi:ABC-2 type transport system ATP-binding protein